MELMFTEILPFTKKKGENRYQQEVRVWVLGQNTKSLVLKY